METCVMKRLPNLLLLPSDEAGQDAAEYALLIGLIALVIVIAVTALGINLSTVWFQILADLMAAM
jgi:Flp pilus assembly pilin Flp